ncbi:MAG: hypothetical protein AB7S44_01495 [Spirochaetales bacterium]
MKINKYLSVNFIIFFVAAILLILSPLALIVNFFAMFLLSISVLMGAYYMTKNYNETKKQIIANEKEIILELATEEGGEQYIYKNANGTKNWNKRINSALREKLTTIIAVWFIGAVLLYFSITLLISFF